MNKSETIQLLEVILKSYKINPSQNNFEINISGVTAQNTGGIGSNISPSGAGESSTTIGMQASMDNAQISIAQKSADEAIINFNNSVISNLQEIINEMKTPSPDASKVKGFFQKIRDKTGEIAIVAIIKFLLKEHGIEV